eukprot:2502522-Pleurochrysis_carterae.AAC.2
MDEFVRACCACAHIDAHARAFARVNARVCAFVRACVRACVRKNASGVDPRLRASSKEQRVSPE